MNHATDPARNVFVARADSVGNGPRVAVKDCIDIAGLPTRNGSAAFDGAEPAKANAAVVDRLLEAGCAIIGKTNMHELAYGMTGINAHTGTPVNPRWPDRIPGGSSSGSAVAVAAGLCDFAVGTDTGGSVRQPAICCGVYGIKPSFGRIPRTGVHPAQSTLDCVGLLARDMDMLTRGMQFIDPTFTPQTLHTAPRLTRIAAELDGDVGEALVYTLMEALPDLPYATLDGMEDAFRAGLTIIAAETLRAHGHLLDAGAPLGADVAARLNDARRITPDDLAQAERVRGRFTAAVDALLAENDALITPALPVVPPTLAEAEDPASILPLTRFLRPFNLSGHPAIVLPIDAMPGALPVGLQLIGRKGDDARLCAIAAWLAQCLPAPTNKETI